MTILWLIYGCQILRKKIQGEKGELNKLFIQAESDILNRKALFDIMYTCISINYFCSLKYNFFIYVENSVESVKL